MPRKKKVNEEKRDVVTPGSETKEKSKFVRKETSTGYKLVKESSIEQTQHYSISQLDEYPGYYSFKNNPIPTIDKDNKTPRIFPIHCSVKNCVWNGGLQDGEDGLGNCSKKEAFNVIEAAELEIDNKNDCPWYGGMSRRATLWSLWARNS